MSTEDERAENALNEIAYRAGGTTVGVEQARALLRIAQALERIADSSDTQARAAAITVREDYAIGLEL